jgi:hypothetical protein
MARIAGLDTCGTVFFDHLDPEWAIWLATLPRRLTRRTP